MSKPKLIFVTVGTSAIDNCQSAFPSKGNTQTPVEAVSKKLRENKVTMEAALLNSTPQTDERNKSLVYNLQRELPVFESSIGTGNMLNRSRKVSAEVASLLVMSKEPDIGAFGSKDEIHLIPSETEVGKVCAEANRIALQSRFPQAKIECTPPLEGVRFAGESDEASLEKFRDSGLKQFEEIVKEKNAAFKKSYGSGVDDTLRILDVTGGFKGLILFAPILCAEYVLMLYYFYQEAKRPIRFKAYDFRSRFEGANKPRDGNYSTGE